METKIVQRLVVRFNDGREAVIQDNKYRVELAKLSNKYNDLIKRFKNFINERI